MFEGGLQYTVYSNFNPISTLVFDPSRALGRGGGYFLRSSVKIGSRHCRELKFLGLIAYITLYRIC